MVRLHVFKEDCIWRVLHEKRIVSVMKSSKHDCQKATKTFKKTRFIDSLSKQERSSKTCFETKRFDLISIRIKRVETAVFIRIHASAGDDPFLHTLVLRCAQHHHPRPWASLCHSTSSSITILVASHLSIRFQQSLSLSETHRLFVHLHVYCITLCTH